MMIFFAILMIPFIEISLAIAVIREFGFANAFFAWMVSFVLGLGLFRTSSLRLTVGVGKAMREGKPPGLAALDGALVGLAGVLFLLPGYFSDFFALLLLVPPLRKLAAKRLLRMVVVKTGMGDSGVARDGFGPSRRHTTEGEDVSSAVIDVDAIVVEDSTGEKTVSENVVLDGRIPGPRR